MKSTIFKALQVLLGLFMVIIGLPMLIAELSAGLCP